MIKTMVSLPLYFHNFSKFALTHTYTLVADIGCELKPKIPSLLASSKLVLAGYFVT